MTQLALFDSGPGTFLYFIAEADGLRVKNGITTDVLGRLKDLRTANPGLVLMSAYPECGRGAEDYSHQYFADLHADREWFYPKTIEFKATALGAGLPPRLFEQALEARNDARRIWEAKAAHFDVQTATTLALADQGYRQARIEQRQVLQKIANWHGDSFRWRQPIREVIEAIWRARLDGSEPFALENAELTSSVFGELLSEEAA